MDNPSRVGHVSPGSGIKAGNSRDGGGSSSGNSYTVGKVRHSVPGSVAKVGGRVGRVSGVWVSSQASVTINSVKSVSISLCGHIGGQTNLR